MAELQSVVIKTVNNTVVVTGHLKLREGREGRKRFYTRDALDLAKQKFPNLEIGKVISGHKINNHSDNNKGEWVFEIVSQDNKKPVVPEVLADARQDPVHKDKGDLKDVAEPTKKVTNKRTRKTLKSVKEESKEVTGD